MHTVVVTLDLHNHLTLMHQPQGLHCLIAVHTLTLVWSCAMEVVQIKNRGVIYIYQWTRYILSQERITRKTHCSPDSLQIKMKAYNIHFIVVYLTICTYMYMHNIHYLNVSHRMFLSVVVYLLCQPLLHFRVQCQEVGGEGQSTGSGLMATQDQDISISCNVAILERVQFGSSASICHLFKYTLVLLQDCTKDVQWCYRSICSWIFVIDNSIIKLYSAYM